MTQFFRLLSHNDKATSLATALSELRNGNDHQDSYSIEPSSLARVPSSPFAYWLSEKIRSVFTSFEEFEPKAGSVRAGTSTGDDFRFVRTIWEIESKDKFGRWKLFAKGGSFSRYYTFYFAVVDWYLEGLPIELTFAGARVRKPDYFRPGITWPLRGIRYSSQVIPEGAVFSVAGKFATAENQDQIFKLLALTNTIMFDFLIGIFAGKVGGVQYEAGIIQRIPVPCLANPSGDKLALLALKCVNLRRALDTTNELSHIFHVPALVKNPNTMLKAQAVTWAAAIADSELQIMTYQSEIDNITFHLYGVEGNDRDTIEESHSVGEENSDNLAIFEEADEAATTTADIAPLATALISYSVGCILGRWDIRLATHEREATSLPDPFAPLPVCSPGMLTGDDGLPATEAPPDYPLAIAWDGILVDDPGHPQDAIGRIREVLGVIWGKRADAIYEEAVQILAGGGHDLRPWFHATFFDEHIKRYSKSRRKAPIYWRLATPSNSYALWLYYHRFSKDTLYRVIEGYVTPKVQYEERQADTLRAEAGANPTALQRRAIEAQEGFVEELRTFRDEIERVAPLWNPDLNDGVIINFAPLWRLTPRPRGWQKECRDAWTKLARGDYDWAHLAMHLWPERVVPKCREDRSLAIAHGLDGEFWIEGENGKWQPRHVTDDALEALIAERTSVAVRDALARLLDAPTEAVAPKRAARQERPAAKPKRARKGQGAEQLPLG